MNEQNNNEKKTEKAPESKSTPNKTGKLKIKQSWKTWAIWRKLSRLKTMNKEKKFYLYTAVSCAAALVAIVIIAVAISANDVEPQAGVNGTNNSAPMQDSSNGNGNSSTDNKPVITTPEGMIMPVETAALGSDFGFYYNKTLDSYYEHAGVDFIAEAGAKVFAAEDGTIESIYKDDLLSGTEIVINHGNGLKTVYRFVNESAGIKVGYKVKKGDEIATVAEANGDEYKDGPHLHFEVLKGETSVDPATYLTLEEK